MAVYEDKRARGKTPKVALRGARDVAGLYIVRGLSHAPACVRYYNAVTKAMMAYDKTKCKSRYQHILQEVFANRGILRPKTRILSNLTWQNLNLKNDDDVIKSEHGWVVRSKKIGTLKLSDHLEARTLVTNPLFNVEIEVPMDTYFEFDTNGNLIDQIQESTEEIVNAARACLVQLDTQEQVSDDEDTMFAIVDGKLVRTHIE